MRWHLHPHRPTVLLLLAHGCRVARVEPQGSRHLVQVRYAEVHVFAVCARRDDALRFAERELWSGTGELADPLWPEACNPSGAGTRRARGIHTRERP